MGAHWLIIVDENHEPAGILSSKDVLGTKPTKVIQDLKITRDKLCNKMIMTPITDVPCMDEDLLKHAKVGHIVETMKEAGATYLLVVKKHEEGHQICGLFYKLQINSQLHDSVFVAEEFASLTLAGSRSGKRERSHTSNTNQPKSNYHNNSISIYSPHTPCYNGRQKWIYKEKHE